MNNTVFQKVEKAINHFCEQTIKKWEFLNWIQIKTKRGELEDLIQKLPKGLILSLKGGVKQNRAIISQVTESEYKIVSVGIESRHPCQRIFPANQLPPPLSALIRGKKDNIYIQNPLENPLTQYMRELVIDKQINAIFYVKVETKWGTWFIIVDATEEKKEIGEEERSFIKTISREIISIEEEKEKIKEEIRTIALFIETKTLEQVIEFQSHLLGNSQMVMGGLIKRICQKACQNSAKNCRECEQKAHHILSHSSKIDNFLRVFSTIANDIKKAEKINLSSFDFQEIGNHLLKKFPYLTISYHQTITKTDKRKLEKFLKRIVKKIYSKKHPAEIEVGKQKIIITQEGKKIAKLEKYSSLRFLENKTNHSIEDLKLITSFLILKKIGIKFSFQPEKLEIIL